ncbi:MAG: helix-turn-helix domain-containing protein [Flavobacteriaceae bacterium]
MESKDFTAVQVQHITAEALLQKFSDLEQKINNLNKKHPFTEKLLTRFEVSELLGISLVTIHNWVKANILIAYRIGNKVRFKEAEVLNALQSINAKKSAQ